MSVKFKGVEVTEKEISFSIFDPEFEGISFTTDGGIKIKENDIWLVYYPKEEVQREEGIYARIVKNIKRLLKYE